MRFKLACWMGLVAVTGTACGSSNLFQCQSNDQCTLEGDAGVCQDNGFCSFPDTDCASGVRYGGSAPPGLAGMCVELAAGSGGETAGCVGANCVGTSSTTLGTSTSTGTSSGDAVTGSATTDAVSVTEPPVTSEPATTVDPETTSSSGNDTTTDESDTASSSGPGTTTTTTTTSTTTTTTTGDPLCPEVLDEFDNGVADEAPWIVWDTDPGDILELNNRLRFEVLSNTPGFSSIALTNVDMVDGYAVAHLSGLPQAMVAQFFLRVTDPSDSPRAEIVLSGNTRLEVRVNDIVTETLIISPAAEMWLEVYADGNDALYFAYSVNGNDFFLLGDVQGPLSIDDVHIVMMAGAHETFAGANHFVDVDDFEYCSHPFGS